MQYLFLSCDPYNCQLLSVILYLKIESVILNFLSRKPFCILHSNKFPDRKIVESPELNHQNLCNPELGNLFLPVSGCHITQNLLPVLVQYFTP